MQQRANRNVYNIQPSSSEDREGEESGPLSWPIRGALCGAPVSLQMKSEGARSVCWTNHHRSSRHNISNSSSSSSSSTSSTTTSSSSSSSAAVAVAATATEVDPKRGTAAAYKILDGLPSWLFRKRLVPDLLAHKRPHAHGAIVRTFLRVPAHCMLVTGVDTPDFDPWSTRTQTHRHRQTLENREEEHLRRQDRERQNCTQAS